MEGLTAATAAGREARLLWALAISVLAVGVLALLFGLALASAVVAKPGAPPAQAAVAPKISSKRPFFVC